MEFPNLEYMRLRLSVALILSYKRSTHTKKKREPSLKEKNHNETTRKQNSRERLKVDRGES